MESAKFNDRVQVTELALGHSVGDGSLWKLNYDYGEIDSNGDVDTAKNTGNIARQTLSFNGLTNPLVQNYKYDSLYRLTEAKETVGANQTWKQQFGYDRYGNRLTHNKFVGTTPITLDNRSHPTIDPLTNRFNPNQGFGYDKNGNLTVDAEGRSFTFNGDNKQTVVMNGSLKIGEYFYDGEGKRVKKKAYDATGVLKEETIFVYSAGKLIAEYSTEPPQNPTINYTATDQLGSPRVITDGFGQVKSRRDFQPFGEEVINNIGERPTNLKYGTADGIRQKFTGYQKDEETQLDFAEARMYENRHGRFTAVDPLLASGKSANPQTFNRYVYVMNNPLLYTDPKGLQAAMRVYVSGDPGNRHFVLANYKPKGFKEFVGEERVNAVDGYTYRVTSRSIIAVGKSINAVSYPLMAPSVSATSGTETATLHKFAEGFEGGKRQAARNAIAAAATAPLIVACAVGCPALLAGAGGAAVSSTGAGSAIGLGVGLGAGLGAAALLHIPGGGGQASGGLSPELKGELGNIYDQYDKASGECECAANLALEAFKKSGIDGRIVQLETGLPTLLSSDGTIISRHGFHQAVQVGDQFFDSLAGPEGATGDGYQTLIQHDKFHPLTITTPREYIPPRP